MSGTGSASIHSWPTTLRPNEMTLRKILLSSAPLTVGDSDIEASASGVLAKYSLSLHARVSLVRWDVFCPPLALALEKCARMREV